MQLNSQNSQFIFNLPSDFIPKTVNDKYMPLIEKNYSIYGTVLDYLNATVKSFTFPGMDITMPDQRILYGKNVGWRPATNLSDLYTQDLDIEFRSVDGHLNYLIIMECVREYYLSTDPNKTYSSPLVLTLLDQDRDGIYRVTFRNVLARGLTPLSFNYNDQVVNEKTFNLSIHFVWIDTEIIIPIKDLTSRVSLVDYEMEKTREIRGKDGTFGVE